VPDALDDLLAELRQFARERDWAQFHDPKNLSMLVASDAGELLHLFRWVRTEDADEFASRPENWAPITLLSCTGVNPAVRVKRKSGSTPCPRIPSSSTMGTHEWRTEQSTGTREAST
jgi:hypothetical protein